MSSQSSYTSLPLVGHAMSEVPRGSIVVPFLGLPYRVLYMNPKKELLWSPWVDLFLCPEVMRKN